MQLFPGKKALKIFSSSQFNKIFRNKKSELCLFKRKEKSYSDHFTKVVQSQLNSRGHAFGEKTRGVAVSIPTRGSAFFLLSLAPSSASLIKDLAARLCCVRNIFVMQRSSLICRCELKYDIFGVSNKLKAIIFKVEQEKREVRNKGRYFAEQIDSWLLLGLQQQSI